MIKKLWLGLACAFLTMPLFSKTIDGEADLYGAYEITLPSKTKLSAMLENEKISLELVSEEGSFPKMYGNWNLEGWVLIAMGEVQGHACEVQINLSDVTSQSLKRGVFVTATVRALTDDDDTDQEKSNTIKMMLKKIS